MKNINIVVAISELSGRIYAGVPLRSGVLGTKKTDVTESCIFAVTQFLNEEKEFTYHEYPDDYNVYTAIPTHWMPLPELPGSQEVE